MLFNSIHCIILLIEVPNNNKQTRVREELGCEGQSGEEDERLDKREGERRDRRLW